MLALAGPDGEPLVPAGGVPVTAGTPATAVPAGAEAAHTAAVAAFDGDWSALVERMGLGGKVRILADRCVLTGHDHAALHLQISAAFRRMLDPAVRDRLTVAVSAALGRSVRLDIDVAEDDSASMEETPLARRESARAAQQVQAAESIRSDPFVRGLIEEMGGVLLDTSIRPVSNQVGNAGGM